MDLPKAYNPKEVEDDIYKRWENSGFFNPDNLVNADDQFWKADNFSMAMPPPNVTGKLHIGHALFLTIQDIMARHARMSGHKTLWLPGTDHAAIATNYVVERELWEKEKKTRFDIGREEFLKRVEQFIDQTKGHIQSQIRKMGASCDWSREKYTLSPELSIAVRTIFKKMYEAGLIYRGDRIVNWCPRCGTTLADDEVEYVPKNGKLYFIRYPLTNGEGDITIATTRPETMLADTAIAVHPDDKRYKDYTGQSVMLPLLDRELPIITDRHVDREFGTGALKVTPGHDLNDFAIGQRHKLHVINLFTREGKIDSQEAVDHGFQEYAGLTGEEARQKIVADLQEAGFLEKTEDITHNVGVCYRCNTVIEPIISKQWFVSVDKPFTIENKTFQKTLKLKAQTSLKELALAAVKTGTIKIVPERFTKIYVHWMENLRDWNISRQLWFGHQLPIWYCHQCSEIIVSTETPLTCPECNSDQLIQDPDTLDTWFSSSLWTFSTLGWPQESDDLKQFHPTNILETGYDILFFWVARMVMMTGFALNDIPFRTIYLHGLVRDDQGRKMSKSLRNIIDPLDMIEQYGTDAVRLSLVIGTTPGNDLKISPEKIKTYRNFANKLWNIARYILSNKNQSASAQASPPNPKTLADQWILTELEQLTQDTESHLQKLQFGLAGEGLTNFTWNKFADWYIEISKIEGDKAEILLYVLTQLLKLWHPFIPFVTEYIWGQLYHEPLMVQPYPAISQTHSDPKPMKMFTGLQRLITDLRNLRAEYNLPTGKTFACYLPIPKSLAWVADQKDIIEGMTRLRVNFAKVDENKRMPYLLWNKIKVYLVIPDFDPKKEHDRTTKILKQAKDHLEILDKQLKNKQFLKKAPETIVAKLKNDHASAEEKVAKLKEKIKQLK